MPSFTEENYLKLIYALSARQPDGVTTNALAEQTNTRAASVSDMLRKLAEKGLVNYRKYQGVTLTDEGCQQALQIVRRHRLWEVFLVEKLGFGWDEVHDMAEELEHIRADELTDRLASFLGNPQFDPHGDPIPASSGELPPTRYRPLCDVAVGETVPIMGVLQHSPAFLQHLNKAGLVLGCVVKICEISTFDRSLTLAIDNCPPIFVSADVSRNVLVG
jgi:DtxR family transcriptional regulator, Mn-dependent transcriptional regulator